MAFATGRYVAGRISGGRWVRIAAASALLLICTGRVQAADSAGTKADAGTKATAAPRNSADINSLDEVVVTGKLDSLSGIREAIKESEDRFYARYNELNKDQDFDVACRREPLTGSRINRDICQAKVVDETATQQARDFVTGTSNVPVTPITVLTNSGAAEMRQRALHLLRSDPELMQDLLEHAKLEQMYKEMSRRKFKWHLFRSN